MTGATVGVSTLFFIPKIPQIRLVCWIAAFARRHTASALAMCSGLRPLRAYAALKHAMAIYRKCGTLSSSYFEKWWRLAHRNPTRSPWRPHDFAVSVNLSGCRGIGHSRDQRIFFRFCLSCRFLLWLCLFRCHFLRSWCIYTRRPLFHWDDIWLADETPIDFEQMSFRWYQTAFLDVVWHILYEINCLINMKRVMVHYHPCSHCLHYYMYLCIAYRCPCIWDNNHRRIWCIYIYLSNNYCQCIRTWWFLSQSLLYTVLSILLRFRQCQHIFHRNYILNNELYYLCSLWLYGH